VHVKEEADMKKRNVIAIGVLLSIVAAYSPAQSIPIGFSAVGGLGYGYYSMGDLNRHIGSKRQDLGISLDELSNGVNFRLEGRVWVYDRAAVTGGYEYYWGETSSTGTSTSISYSAPTDVYTIGVIVPVIRKQGAFYLCLGINRCMAKSIFEMKEEDDSSRLIPSFKGDDSGYEAYAEIETKFLNPLEIGLQLGYRGLKIETLNSIKDGAAAYFEDGTKVNVDYSGVFFYLTTAIRLW
jgi:hypothetical protein